MYAAANHLMQDLMSDALVHTMGATVEMSLNRCYLILSADIDGMR